MKELWALLLQSGVDILRKSGKEVLLCKISCPLRLKYKQLPCSAVFVDSLDYLHKNYMYPDNLL